MKGVNVRHDAKRAAKGNMPWGVWVEVIIGGKETRGATHYATEAEARAAHDVVCLEIGKLRAEAEENARRLKALQVPELPQAPKGTTLFETLALRWLAEHVEPMCTAATYSGYKRALDNHLLPIMRTWPMHDDTMTKQRIKDVLKVQLVKRGVPLPTRLNCQACLSAFFNWATGELPPRQFTVNTALKLAKFVRNEDEKHIALKQPPNPMTRVQVEAFLKWEQEHYPEIYPLFLWLADEGSRVGEATALKWDRLELAGGKGHVVEAFSQPQRRMQRKKGIDRALGEKDTKTHRADQYVDLSPRVVEEFGRLKAANRELWLKRGRRPLKEPEHCLLTSKFTPRRPDKVVYRAFHEGCKALEFVGQTGTPFTVHCLRDTFATLSLLEGKPLGWVSMMLGHQDTETTRKHYVKWIRLVEVNPLAKAGTE